MPVDDFLFKYESFVTQAEDFTLINVESAIESLRLRNNVFRIE